MTRSLEQVIANAREHASVLRVHGHTAQADVLDRFAEEVADAAAPWLEMLTEAECRLRSGRRERWFRDRYAEWEAQGLAAWDERRKCRVYRACIVPQRVHLSAVREDAREAASREAAS